MTTPTASQVFNPLGVLGTLLIAAAMLVLLVPLALPADSAQAALHGFVLQLLATVALLGSALFALVAASANAQEAPAMAPKATARGASRTAVQPAGYCGAAA